MSGVPETITPGSFHLMTDAPIEDDGLAAAKSHVGVSKRLKPKGDSGAPASSQWQMYSGLKQISAKQQILLKLAERCGQRDVTEALDHFLSMPYPGEQERDLHPDGSGPARYLPPIRSKEPRLLLLHNSEKLLAAVLLHEYHFFGISTGILVSADMDGWRTIIAPMEEKPQVARMAADFLLGQGRHVVLLSFTVSPSSEDEGSPAQNDLSPNSLAGLSRASRAARRRSIRRVLPLASTMDSTLANMGAHTRRNLRAMHRRVLKEYGAVYVTEAEISLDEFLAINRQIAHVVPDWLARWRYDSARSVAGGIFAGLRAANGEWLSVLGGRRTRDTTFVDWQMNVYKTGQLSLVSAMRYFFLEDEVKRGIQWMRFEGGTPHSMSSAFLEEEVYDVVFSRPSLSPRYLQRLAKLMPLGGALAETLLDPSLTWRSD